MTVVAAFLAEQRTAIVLRAEAVLGEARLRHYGSLGPEGRRSRLESLYDQLLAAVTDRDVGGVVSYARELARERFSGGYDLSEVQVAINALEETIWKEILADLPPAQLAEALGLVSTVLGVAKDTLAREYVALATRAHAPSLDLRGLFTGTV